MKVTKFLMVSGMIAVVVALTGCRRNYQVIHARPAVDSTMHDDVEKASDEDVFDEPLIDIPDAPQEEDFKRVKSSDRKEYDEYVKGHEGQE
jgi:hypothetical protein